MVFLNIFLVTFFLSVINAVKDENCLNKDIMEKLKLTIEFYKEKDENMVQEQSVGTLKWF